MDAPKPAPRNPSQINPTICQALASDLLAMPHNTVCLDLATTGLTVRDEVMVASLFDVATGVSAQFKCLHTASVHPEAARYNCLPSHAEETLALSEQDTFWALIEGKQVIAYNAEFTAQFLGTSIFMHRTLFSLLHAPQFNLVGIADMVAQWFYYAKATPPDLHRKSVKFMDVVSAMQWSLPYAKSDPYGHLLAKPALLWRMVQQVGAFDAEHPLKDQTIQTQGD